MVMEALKQLDEVAYVRYASIYRHFKDADAFVNEIKHLNGNEEKPNSPQGPIQE
jgi:transcriptional repressor NrdR